MSVILAESNSFKTKVSQIYESSFDRSLFDMDAENYKQGIPEAGLIDAFEGLAEEASTPKRYDPSLPEGSLDNNSFNIGALCEKVIYLPVKNTTNSYIFPLRNSSKGIKGYKSSTYLPLKGKEMDPTLLETINEGSINSLTESFIVDDYSVLGMSMWDGMTSSANIINSKNLLLFDEGKNNWISNWKTSNNENLTVNNVRLNSERADDCLEIKAPVEDAFFEKEIYIESSGYYVLSFSARSVSSTTKIRPYFQIKGESIEYDPVAPYCNYLVVDKKIQYTTGDGYGRNNIITIPSQWTSIHKVCYLEGNKTYIVKIVWPKDNNTRTSTLRIGSLYMTKGDTIYPYNYKYIRHIDYEPSNIYYPLIFNLDQIKGTNKKGSMTLTTDGWTLTYKKYIADNPNVGLLHEHYDSLGTYYWGFKDNLVILNGENQTNNYLGNHFYNNWIQVIVSWKKTTNNITITIFNELLEKITMTIENVVAANLTKKVAEQQNIEYNLNLGGTDTKVLYFDKFRDLRFIPFLIDDTNMLEKETLALSGITKTGESTKLVLRSGLLEKGVF